MTRMITGKGLVAATVMVLAALFGGAAPAGAATGPDGFPILDADSGNVAHHCESLGKDAKGYQAIVCVDIDTYGDSSGYYATGAVEAFCQNSSSVIVACYDLHIDALFANADSGATSGFYECYGDCGGGRQIVYPTTYDYTGGKDCTTSSGHQVWTVAVRDTYIVTPGGEEFTVAASGYNDGDNYSSGHYWVCP